MYESGGFKVVIGSGKLFRVFGDKETIWKVAKEADDACFAFQATDVKLMAPSQFIPTLQIYCLFYVS